MGDAGPTTMLVSPDLDIGGAQQTVRSLAAELPRVGCDVVICTFRTGPLADEIRGLGIPVVVLPDRRHSVVRLPLFLLEAMRRRRDLLEVVDRYGVEVVVTLAGGPLELLVMTLVRRVQVWWRIGNVAFTLRPEHLPAHAWLLRPKRWAHRWLRRIGTTVVDGIIAVSDDTARAVVDHLGDVGDRVTVVVNGVDLPARPTPAERDAVRADLGFAPTDRVMTMVGTFKEQKGHVVLLDALARLPDGGPTRHLVLVGDGDQRPTIEEHVQTLGLTGRVHLLGSRRDVVDLLAASDSFVLPSLWEGMSVALLEAMGAGLPVVATSVSGTRQVITDGVEGWLVPPGDASALAAAIGEVLADPSEASRRGDAARRRVEASFSTRRCAEQLRDLFEVAATRRRGRRRTPRAVSTVRVGGE
jgi:glycosyltransferase involved in cell wall biosynthesis